MSNQIRRWNEQPVARRRSILALAALDAALRVWAVADLARRPASEVRGPKVAWVLALTLVNSVGVVPAAYLGWGRHAR